MIEFSWSFSDKMEWETSEERVRPSCKKDNNDDAEMLQFAQLSDNYEVKEERPQECGIVAAATAITVTSTAASTAATVTATTAAADRTSRARHFTGSIPIEAWNTRVRDVLENNVAYYIGQRERR